MFASFLSFHSPVQCPGGRSVRCRCAILFFLVASGRDMADAITNTVTVAVCRRPACKKRHRGRRGASEEGREAGVGVGGGHKKVRRVDVFLVLCYHEHNCHKIQQNVCESLNMK